MMRVHRQHLVPSRTWAIVATAVMVALASAACAPGVTAPSDGDASSSAPEPSPNAAVVATFPADVTAPLIESAVASPAAGVYPPMSPKRFELTVVASDRENGQTAAASLTVEAVITRVGSVSPVRSLAATTVSGAVTPLVWNLRDARGRVVAAGAYRMAVNATDDAGNRSATRTVPVRVLSLAQVAARATGTRAKTHALAITALGVRKAGGSAERAAADYVAERFREFGYARILRPAVPLKDGSTSQNVIAVKPGASARSPIVIVGAHIDSRADKRSPGGNDNASGVGVMLETARVMAAIPTGAEIWFVGFGAEEIYDGNPDHHHEGSRALAKALTRDQLRRGVRMVNVDMVGVGSRLQLGTQRGAAQTYARYHLATARSLGYDARYASHGSGSDHEPFVKLGIDVAYYDRGPDPLYHTPKDTAARVSSVALLEASRALVASLVRHTAR